MTNRRLAEVIARQQPLTMSSRETVQAACRQMWEQRVGAVLVINSRRQLSGIFTGRDAVRSLAEGRDPATTPLSTVMTRRPDTISPGCTALDALRAMRDGGYRHLPVVDDGRVCGIVSRGDFAGLELDLLETEDRVWERIG